MKFLLNANVSWRFVPILKKCFDDCVHVDDKLYIRDQDLLFAFEL